MDGRGGRLNRRDVSRGQAETVGVVLILALTLIGATVALAFGASGLDNARINAQEGGVEHAMTQLDSRSAMVALGDSNSQRVPLSASGQGSYRIDSDAGWIKVVHSDHDGNGSTEVIYNETLGALVYERDDKLVAYQGGGVWQTQGTNATMVSPPEFHYQSATLTLPVIQVEGDSNVGGAAVTASISREIRARHIYPNQTATYDGTGDPYHNPIREGNVTVTVRSDYYQAWATYFRTRTTGVVSVDHANETAAVKLVSLGAVGSFSMPADGNSLEIRGLGDGHPITDFNITLRPDDTDSANFANLQWTLYAEQGSQQFELHLRDSGKNNTLSTADCTVRDIGATIYYSDRNGDPYHGWHDDVAFNTECDDLDGDGDNETYLEADLVGDSELTMKSLSQSDLQHFDASGSSLKDPVNFSEHGDEGVGWEDPPATFNASEKTTMDNLTNHYLSLMGPDVELAVEDKNSNTVNEESSSGVFEQTAGGGRFITFLHITENRVVIELE
jgi:hypothetical protein